MATRSAYLQAQKTFATAANAVKTPEKTVKTLTKKTAVKKSSAKAEAVKAALQKVETAMPKATKGGKAPHIIVIARAGTGKTTTLVGALHALNQSKQMIKPSVQQVDIWDAVCVEKPGTIRFAAFNKSIATELQDRVPAGVEAATLHSFGNAIVKDAARKFIKMNGWKTDNIIEKLTKRDPKDLFREGYPIILIKRLVSLCKMELIDWKSPTFPDAVQSIAAHHDLDINGNLPIILDMLPKILDAACDMSAARFEIDFDDMIWLPVILKLPVKKVGLMMVDEAQDLNRCQQELVLMMGERLCLCGDPKQAIYGFAGADCQSMERMETRLLNTPRGVEVLPLTTTYRCGKAIVAEANKIVPDFHAHESNGNGSVGWLDAAQFMPTVSEADMVLCRINAPLVSVCFRLLKAGRKARIQGRDIGEGLIALIKKMRADSTDTLLEELQKWHDKETAKLAKKKFVAEAQQIALDDKYDCLVTFCGAADSVQGVMDFISKVFSDAGPGVLLSSVHRAKGLEARKVYILQPEKMPHAMAKSDWQVEQEYNLKYVAVTRAKETLVFVRTADAENVDLNADE